MVNFYSQVLPPADEFLHFMAAWIRYLEKQECWQDLINKLLRYF
jgi:hypothetical protein